MVHAFEKYKEISKLEEIHERHREWLKQYEGLKFSIAEDGKHKMKWASEKKRYCDELWKPEINCIGRLKNRTRIEFDGEKEKAKEFLEEVRKKLIDSGWGFIRSTHNGKSDYLWVEFSRDVTDKEVQSFLVWICPSGAEIDLNFASSRRVFPILFAIHWKHSYDREDPIEFVEGKQIDYDSLKIPSVNKIPITTTNKDGFAYATFKAARVFSDKGRAEIFNQAQPVFYDKNGLWWLWNPLKFYWEIVDDVDILNMIEQATGQDIITPKNRTLILNSLKQECRKRVPEPIKPTWIQFKNKIVDIINGNQFDATPKYFVTNPIPHELHPDNFTETPTIDKIFEEWVGEDYVQTLYEIISYCLMPSYPIHRIFCFIGGGLNGKSKFLELLRKFVGENNCCSTELDSLLHSRFEVTRLHKRLVCQMGETNFNEMSKTSMLKKLSGGDLIGLEYKNKNPFEEINYAKILISTNNLPTTTDKTIGFYRRWLIIDFPNRFSEKKDILEDIPEEEYNSLALKCTFILKDLLDKRSFHKEGSIEDRIEKYESKSNFLEEFLRLFTESGGDCFITKADFYKKFKSWCKEKRHREMSETSVGLQMKKSGIESQRRYFQWLFDGKGGQLRCWESIKWKE